MNTKRVKMRKIIFTIILMSALSAGAENDFSAWHNSDKWDVAGDASRNPDNIRRLVGGAGDGLLVNGKEGKCPSLVTKRRNYRDVEIHVEFMVFSPTKSSSCVTMGAEN